MRFKHAKSASNKWSDELINQQKTNDSFDVLAMDSKSNPLPEPQQVENGIASSGSLVEFGNKTEMV